MNDNHLGEAKPRGPGEPEGDILYHDGVVDVGPGVDQTLEIAKKLGCRNNRKKEIQISGQIL